MIKRIRSLIKETFSEKVLKRIEGVYRTRSGSSGIWLPKDLVDNAPARIQIKIKEYSEKKDKYLVRVRDNNDKIAILKIILMDEFGNTSNYGTGTNRAVMIKDGYVFKIALDDEGVIDNWHAFYMSKYLYPEATKIYESNGLINVCEYIKVYPSASDFLADRENIMNSLDALADKTSLMLDIGFNVKNYSNWGVRPKTGKAVCLDTGYIYTELEGIDLTCNSKDCNTKNGIVPLQYTNDYSTLMCPKCKKKYSSLELHKIVGEEERVKMYNLVKKKSRFPVFEVNKPVTYFEIDQFGDVEECESTDYNKDNVVKPKITSEEAEFILNQYMGLYHQITEREESGFVVDYSLKKEQELYRKILLEYKYGKPFEDLNNEQKSFRPEDKLIPKRKCNFEERYNEDPIADYVNTKFRGLNEVERYEIYEKLKKEDIDIDMLYLTDEEKLELMRNAGIGDPYVDELEQSIVDYLDGKTQSVPDVKGTNAQECNFEELENMMVGFYDPEDNEDNYDNNIANLYEEDDDDEDNEDMYEVYKSNPKVRNGQVEVDYVYYDNLFPADVARIPEIDLPCTDNATGERILDIKIVGHKVYFDCEHPGFIYTRGQYQKDPSYIDYNNEEESDKCPDFVDNYKYENEDDIMTDEELLLQSMQDNNRFKIRY